MKNIISLLLGLFVVMAFSIAGFGQAPNMVKRTTTKTDRFDFGSGGTVVINGAPSGSIKVQGWAKNEIEITAVIEVQAANEADLARIAEVTGFITDESAIRTSVITVGVHNKFGLKKLPKNFPKQLIGLPFTLNYVISVPRYSDLEIDGGKGDLSIAGVEGSIRANFIESKANVEIIAGNTTLIIGTGTLDVAFGVRGWRGRYTDVQVAAGDLNVKFPSNMSAEIDATILRTGMIENHIPDLKPRDRKVPFTDKSIIAKAGVGGAPLKFVVGVGNMKLDRLVTPL
ncbi:MAG TPA: hypothetical protein PLP21_08380 [Pyrinomonadaceae bacterium]|nr:hypothetical protein [Acidobacteriota bacterium]HQZ96322.1 hypothetical protein [Pyrinomonadaceae bacterium]